MSTSAKSSSENHKSSNLFQRLNIRFPWLKLYLVIFIGTVATLDLLDLTISKITNLDQSFPRTPMAKHVKATDRVLEGKMLVALTFDDGPSPSTTPALLDILSKKNTLATFFMLGSMAENSPDIVRRIEREGHEIANHTMYHQNLVWLSPEEIQSDVNASRAVFSSIIKHAPALTRPPYGNYNDVVSSIANTPLILWSVDTLDWQNRNPETILNITLSQVHDGAIILLHDIHPTSVEAVPNIIDALRERGYEFTTISELARIRKIKLSAGEGYYNFRP